MRARIMERGTLAAPQCGVCGREATDGLQLIARRRMLPLCPRCVKVVLRLRQAGGPKSLRWDRRR